MNASKPERGMRKTSFPKVALVYDRANTRYGGAENVLLALHQAFPEAPLFTSLHEPAKTPWTRVFPQVISHSLNSLPMARHLHRWIPFFMPLIFESFDFQKFDIVISVTSAEAKGILTAPHQLHICYLLTPPRYLYQHKRHSLDSHWLIRLPLFRQAALLMLRYLEWWDQAAIFRPDVIIPISRRVAQRVRKFYPAIQPVAPLYPPVGVTARQNVAPITTVVRHASIQTLLQQEYFLIISRLVSYKRIELAIQACAALGKNLVIVGSGPQKSALVSTAQKIRSRSKILFLESVSSSQLNSLYTRCQAVIMPGEEDFGIVALEANRHGKPVLLNVKSGAAELIQDKIHGIHIQEETVQAVMDAVQKWERTSFSSSKIRQNPVKYGTRAFVRQFSSRVERLWNTYTRRTYESS